MDRIQMEELLADCLSKSNAIYSKDYTEDVKFKNFVKYLCNKEVILCIIKFLISLRASHQRPADPLPGFKEYFINYVQKQQMDGESLMNKCLALQRNNEALRLNCEDLRGEIDAAYAHANEEE